jgi:murein DD-endopeptidase MepM/ murein hydrolase activator NlpD
VKRLAGALLAAALLPALVAAGPTLQQRINAQRERTEQLRSQLHASRVELHTATLQFTDLQHQLDETDSAIGGVNARLTSLAYQQTSTERKLDWNATQLSAAQASLKLHDDLLKHRLVNIYEYGDLSYLNALIAARSFSEFVERWEDFRLLIAANQRAVRERKAAEVRVATIQADLERARFELESEERAQQQTRNQLDTLASERSNLVELAATRRRSVASQVAEIENLTAAQEAALEGLILERERELESQQRAAGIAGGGASAPSGSFSWPVTGTITSPFGWRSNPFGGGPEFHPGLDIAAPSGTTVSAAAAGTVIMAQWYGGYGNYILIDHGGGYSTGYGHLSAIYVSNGQSVSRGQAIGAVGSTGQSTGPHLHFEIRIAGKPVDPAPRLH